MNYLLANLKLILAVAAVCSVPSIYLATKQRTPTMDECRAEYARKEEAAYQELQKTVKLNDGKRW